MELDHSFSVPVGIDEAWRVLLDVERLAPCMPGAAIDSVDGDEFTGTVKVKLGPIGLTYKGKAAFVEKDEAARRAVIDARGRDARGNGTAAAKVTATLTEVAGGTTVAVHTELDITGKPAQFGRGVMVDVGNKLIGQFADNLAAELRRPEPGAAADGPDEPVAPDESARPDAQDGAGAPAEPTAPPAERAPAAREPATATRPGMGSEPEPIDLLASVGPAVAKRLAPVALAALVLLLVAVCRRRRRSG